MPNITVLTPKLTPRSGVELAKWLALNQPEVFEALVCAQAGEVNPHLNGITDWLTSIGSSIGTAVKSVGSFLTTQQGIATTAAIGSLYLQTQAQKDALKIQVANAAAGNPLPAISTVGTTAGNSYPVYQGNALTPSIAAQLMPKRNWIPWVAGGLAIFALLLVFSRRR